MRTLLGRKKRNVNSVTGKFKLKGLRWTARTAHLNGTSASNFTLANNKITNSATYGLSITSLVNQNNGGTKIYGNQFSYNPTAISLAAATGASLASQLQIGLAGFAVNTIDNSAVGLLATGFCTYTTVYKLQFTTSVTTQYNVVNSRKLTIVR